MTAPLSGEPRALDPSVPTYQRSSLPTTPSSKSPGQCVSNSEAASGLLTSFQGTDAHTNLPGTPYSVRLQPRRRMQGWVLRAGDRPRPKWRLSSPILSSLLKKESGPRRALVRLSGRHWLGEICKFSFKAWWSRVLLCKLTFALQQSLYAAWVRLSQIRAFRADCSPFRGAFGAVQLWRGSVLLFGFGVVGATRLRGVIVGVDRFRDGARDDFG